jgi:hypothetical protein
MRWFVYFVSILAIISFTNCKKNDTSTYSSDCSGTTKLFTHDVMPVFAAYCIGCHSSGHSLPLYNYSTIFSNRNSIKTDVSNGNMPRGSSLSNAQKNIIICWIDNGAPNN